MATVQGKNGSSCDISTCRPRPTLRYCHRPLGSSDNTCSFTAVRDGATLGGPGMMIPIIVIMSLFQIYKTNNSMSG
jgi:hypothetical protein